MPGLHHNQGISELGMAKVFTIPVAPQMGRRRRESNPDPRYVDGQRLLVEAMRVSWHSLTR